MRKVRIYWNNNNKMASNDLGNDRTNGTDYGRKNCTDGGGHNGEYC